MPRWLTLDNSFDLIAAVIATACFAAVLGTFVIGKHYIIPTFWLAIALLFANLARHGLAGARWAKQILGHIGLLASANLFMGLFFAKTPKELLGALFLPGSTADCWTARLKPGQRSSGIVRYPACRKPRTGMR